MHFKVVRAYLGSKRTISTRLGAGCYKWYQSQSPTSVWGLFGLVWVFDCLAPQSHGTQRRRYVCIFLLTKQTRFKVVMAPLGSKGTISTRLGTGRCKWYQSQFPTLVWGFVWPLRGVCLFGSIISWDTTRTLCLHRGCL